MNEYFFMQFTLNLLLNEVPLISGRWRIETSQFIAWWYIFVEIYFHIVERGLGRRSRTRQPSGKESSRRAPFRADFVFVIVIFPTEHFLLAETRPSRLARATTLVGVRSVPGRRMRSVIACSLFAFIVLGVPWGSLVEGGLKSPSSSPSAASNCSIAAPPVMPRKHCHNSEFHLRIQSIRRLS